MIVFALGACATPTRFTGEPKVPGGPQTCAAVCNGWGMDLVGMIAVGEFSDGCICQVRGATPQPAVQGAGPAAAAAIGVVMQMQADDARSAAAAQRSAKPVQPPPAF